MNMRQICRKVAKEYGVTADEVKREMQLAIDDAYKNVSNDGVTRAYQNQVPRKGKIPTSEEVIRFIASKAK